MNLTDRSKIKWAKKFGKTKYGDTWKEIDVEWYKKIHDSNHILHDDFKKFLKSKKDIKTILEVGCGSGIYPINNKELFKNLEYTGTDFSKAVIDYCKKNSDFQFFEGDFIKMELSKKYDCVFGSAILKEYFEGDMLYESVSSSVRHQLEKTVEDLHFLGIFNLNINGENTILSPSKRRAKIIDLGHCDIYSEDYGAISPDMFSNGKKRDLYDLGLLFG